MAKPPVIRAGNLGLTVKVNLYALPKYQRHFDSEKARLWIKGTVTRDTPKHRRHFNDAGELITILGKWNAERFRSLRRSKRRRP